MFNFLSFRKPKASGRTPKASKSSLAKQPKYDSEDVLRFMEAFPSDPKNPDIPFRGGVNAADKTRYYHTDVVKEKLNQILKTREEPFTIMNLAEQLNILPKDTRQFLDQRIVQSTNSSNFFPPRYLGRITVDLIARASKEFVSADSFCSEYELPHSWIRAHPEISQNGLLKDGDDTLVLKSWEKTKRYNKMFVFTHRQYVALQKDVSRQISEATVRNIPIELTLPFDPNTHFLIVEKIVQDAVSPGVLKQSAKPAGTVTFTPTTFLEDYAHTLIAEVETGSTPYLELKPFYAECRDLFPTREKRVEYERKLTSIGRVRVVGDHWVSNIWLNAEISNMNDTLASAGFVDIKDMFPSAPSSIRIGLIDIATAAVSKTNKVRKVIGSLVTKLLMEQAGEEILSLASDQAHTGWKSMISKKQYSPNRPVLQPGLIMSKLMADYGFSKAIADSIYTKTSAAASESFNQTLDTLASEQKGEFATFWRERIVYRWNLYTAGIDTLPVESADELVQELQQRLTGYMKHLIDDTLGQARQTSILPSSSDYTNAVTELQTSLPGADYQLLGMILNVFATNLGISTDVEAEVLASAKDEIMKNTFQSLHIFQQYQQSQQQEQTGGTGPTFDQDACLVLSVLIALHARLPGREQSLVYATGRAARNLAKSLRIAIEGSPGGKAGRKGKKAAKTALGSVTTNGSGTGTSNSGNARTAPIPADVLASIPHLSVATLEHIEKAMACIKKRQTMDGGDREVLKSVVEEYNPHVEA